MNRSALQYFMLLIFALIFFSCEKEADIPEPPKIFAATINGTDWAPTDCQVEYDSKRRQLHFKASDARGQYYLHVGISLDSVSPLKNYILEGNGNHVAEIVTGQGQYNTDHNLPDAGGIFTLTSLDTIKGTLSGSLHFLSYSADRSNKLIFSADSLNNIPVETYNSSYDGSLVSCIVNGVKTTPWQSRNFFAKITCSTLSDTGPVNKRLELHIQSIVGGYPNHRFILFRIPIDNPVGTYTLSPDAAPYIYCGRMDITTGYWINNYEESYIFNTGTIVITEMDKVKRKMKANFNITYKSPTRQGETIQLSDGSIELNGWQDQ